ncbi:hypothetical protein M885DRAFT_241994 [Pelagophyceae sp. CCMP2097]|nr:hypothetical protein M885DRAFT_241994 [Pelagophyceae sp. CCMP2097]
MATKHVRCRRTRRSQDHRFGHLSGELRPLTSSQSRVSFAADVGAAPAPHARRPATTRATLPGALPLVRMPAVTSKAALEFSLAASGISTRDAADHLRRQAAQQATLLSKKYGLSPAAAAEMSLDPAPEAKGLRRTASLPGMDDADGGAAAAETNVFEERMRAQLARLPPVRRPGVNPTLRGHARSRGRRQKQRKARLRDCSKRRFRGLV